MGVGITRTGGDSRGGAGGVQETYSNSTANNRQSGGEGTGGRGTDLSTSIAKSPMGASGGGDPRDKVRGKLVFVVWPHSSYAAQKRVRWDYIRV